ncbi:putative motility protein [Chitinimonas arctica]|uniref:Putative motility protein n=1 Tax=Chitinimonas arctica TaxID=2594795 RepID=A0A516SC29_9NEIS|nr:YjfB family protein [Chitinimonas arctica]QDQ25701.1 putative motility protein [Chitinimonas arctica]
MDVSSIASTASDMAAVQTANTAAIMVLRKSMDIQQQNAMTLLQALPQPSNPPNLGNRIDVRA